jgi:hypothetical protein
VLIIISLKVIVNGNKKVNLIKGARFPCLPR